PAIASDADIDAIAGDCARAAFGFAGQRCTAGRRILVARDREAELIDALAVATRALVVGEPTDERTEVGPLIDVRARDRIDAVVNRARAEGARLVCGGAIPDGFEHGAWYAPTLLRGVSPQSAVFLEESFGPIATITPFASVDEMLTLVNAVPQGLIATLYGGDAVLRRRFLDATKAGVLKFDCMPSGVHAEAPFGGWKTSGFGPPEHGRWDADFYTRTQAIYGNAPRPD
ncbi:MAG: aldehyde dehydrogenase family protein, partial [Azoarcus sp.]|nr:aldehyde dehydrogenase family protein [Azoarcus sp.]